MAQLLFLGGIGFMMYMKHQQMLLATAVEEAAQQERELSNPDPHVPSSAIQRAKSMIDSSRDHDPINERLDRDHCEYIEQQHTARQAEKLQLEGVNQPEGVYLNVKNW